MQDQCSRTASTYRVLPTVRSARLTTRDSFTFRYGIVEARVLVPEGDWIYPGEGILALVIKYITVLTFMHYLIFFSLMCITFKDGNIFMFFFF